MHSDLISIIVPVYAEELYIEKCIESIVNQTYPHLEIILVDDGSPDKCPEICDIWAKKDARIKVIHKKNGGLVAARKTGMEAATGAYIGYVDGDDWIEENRYEKMLETIKREDVDIVITGFQKELFGKRIKCYNEIPSGVYRGEELENKIFPTMICNPDTLQFGLYTYVWNKLFKREIVYDCQMKVEPNIVIGEDAACVYPAILSANAIAVTDDIGYFYRLRMDSLLRKTTSGSTNIERLQTFNSYINAQVLGSRFENQLKQQILYFYALHLIMMSDNLVKLYPGLDETFPFLFLEKNSNIMIYSVGAYGIHVYKQFETLKEYHITAWIDPDYEQYQDSSFSVVSLETALAQPYDYIIIASTDTYFIREAEKKIKSYGVHETKIVSILSQFSQIMNALRREGIIGDGKKDEK